MLWDAVPTVVALMTFLFKSSVLHEPLSIAQGYAGLMMFTLLKRPLASFPEMSGWCINAYVALQRISHFLEIRNVLGRSEVTGIQSEHNIPVGSIQFYGAFFGWNSVLKTTKSCEKLEKERIAGSSKFSFGPNTSWLTRMSKKIIDDGLISLFSSTGSSHSYMGLEVLS